MSTKLLVSGLVALTASLIPGRADAWTHACNQTSNTIWIAYATDGKGSVFDYGDDGCSDRGVRQTGWYQVAPGACVTPNGGRAYDFNHFFYAEDSKGHVWSSGQNFFCIPWTAYDQCSNSHNNPGWDCGSSKRNLAHTIFYSVSTTNWTLNFTL